MKKLLAAALAVMVLAPVMAAEKPKIIDFIAGQQQKVTIKAEKGDYSDSKKLKKAGEKSKAYVFSVEVWTMPRLFDEKNTGGAPTDLGPGSGIDAL